MWNIEAFCRRIYGRAQLEIFWHIPRYIPGRQGITPSERQYLDNYLTPEARRKPQPTEKIFVTDVNPQAKGQGSYQIIEPGEVPRSL